MAVGVETVPRLDGALESNIENGDRRSIDCVQVTGYYSMIISAHMLYRDQRPSSPATRFRELRG